MDLLLEAVFSRVMARGALEVTTATGRRFVAGTGVPRIHIRFRTRAAQWRLMLDPELALGEILTDGDLVIERGDMAGLLDLLMSQPYVQPTFTSKLLYRARMALRGLMQFNPPTARAATWRIIMIWTGGSMPSSSTPDRQYSCAYFEEAGQSLDDAQLAKKRHIAAKLVLDRPGLRTLDIGCGWGGLSLYLAEMAGARMTGVTLSTEQLGVATARAQERGLRTGWRSGWRITAPSKDRSTVSSRWACSSMWACANMATSSARRATCWRRTA